MHSMQADVYRVLMGFFIVLLFYYTGKPFFSPSIRIALASLTAGALNAFAGGALMGTDLSGLPLRFLIAFLGVGAGVAVLEWVFPENGRRRPVPVFSKARKH